MPKTIKRRIVKICSTIIVSVLVSGSPAYATASGNPRGKTALYVFNRTKLELAEKAVPADDKRIAQLTTWRHADEAAIQALQGLGFKVVFADEHTPLTNIASQDLIVISESVDALEIGTKYRDVAVPLIDMENDLLADLAMTGQKNGRDYGTDDNQRFLWMVNAPHPLSAGLAAGVQNVLTDEHFKMNWGKPGLGAITIATLRGEPEKAAIFAYERGATMNDEALAPARRVSLFIWQDVFENLRPEGKALFKSAVLWATGSSQ